MSVDCFYAKTVCPYCLCLCMLPISFYVSIYSLFFFILCSYANTMNDALTGEHF